MNDMEPPSAVPTDVDIADEIGEHNHEVYIDYLAGRLIKTAFARYPLFNPRGYDRDNGEGAPARQCTSVGTHWDKK